jgi:hypothetical protein
MKTKVIYTDNPAFNQAGEVEKKDTKPEADSLYGGNPAVMADTLEQMKNVRKLLKDRLKGVKEAGEAIEVATADEKVRLQGSKETKGPSLKPYTEAVDVKDRAALSQLVEKAKKENKLFKIGRSMKEGFRYTFLIEEMVKEEASPEFKVGSTVKIISMAGEPEYTNKVGKITMIDDAGQLHGTWGGLALIPGDDKFELVTVINHDTGKIEEKKYMMEEMGEGHGTQITSFEHAQELCQGAKWPIAADEKYFDMYHDKGYEMFVKGSDGNKILTFVKDGEIVNAYDVNDKLVTLEAVMGKTFLPKMEAMPKMEGAPEEHHHDEEHKDEGEYDEEGDMAKSDLQIMADAALELHGMLQDEENLPEWVQAKITLATDYIDTARDYMKAKKDGLEFPEPKEDEEMIKEDASPSLGKRTGVITVAEYKGFLNDALEVVADADGTEKVRLASSTYNMDLPFIGTYGGYIAINSPISDDQSEDEVEEGYLKEAVESWGKEVITLQDFATAVEKLGRDDIDVFPILKGIAAGTHRAFVKHEGKDTTITVLRGDVVEMTLTSGAKKESVYVKEEMEIKDTKFFPGEDGDTEAHIFIEDKGIEDYDLIWDDAKGGYMLTWTSKEEMEEMKEYVTEERHDKKDLKEETKILTTLNEYEPWSGAVSTWELIINADKVEALDFMLEDLYPEGISNTELNDLLWFEASWVLDMLSIDENAVEAEENVEEMEDKVFEPEEDLSDEEAFVSLNDLDEEPVVEIDELEESVHGMKQEVASPGNVVKEVRDFIAQVNKK